MYHQESARLFHQTVQSLERQFPDCARNVSVAWFAGQKPHPVAVSSSERDPDALSFHVREFESLAPEGEGTCLKGCCQALARRDGSLLVMRRTPRASETAVPRLLLYALDRELACREQSLALEEQIDFGKKVVHSMASGFLVLLPDLTVQDANPAACDLLQVSQEQLIGTKLSDIILSDLQVRQIFLTGQPITDRELFIKLKDNSGTILGTHYLRKR